MTIQNFEDIKSWQKARELTSKIYEITSSGGFSKDYGLRDQIQRASVSIMAISQKVLVRTATMSLLSS